MSATSNLNARRINQERRRSNLTDQNRLDSDIASRQDLEGFNLISYCFQSNQKTDLVVILDSKLLVSFVIFLVDMLTFGGHE